jgi:hypothetical protein
MPVCPCPSLSLPIRGIFLSAARLVYAAGQSNIALALLSALYNVHYLEGAAHVLGNVAALRRVLNGSDTKDAPSPTFSQTAGAS